MALTDEQAARLHEIGRELRAAAYPHPDVDLLHKLEDEAATIFGKRTVRQADDVISACDLYKMICSVSKPVGVIAPPDAPAA